MPLQVRFRHAAQQRLLDLPDRGVSHPLTIGRGSGVDLRIPFEPVAPQHAALYLHEGTWVIQPMSGAVTLRGQPLTGPTKLGSGDVITLGADGSAPTLEIDPNRIAGGSAAPAPARAPAAAPSAARPQPAPAPAPIRPRPASPASEMLSQEPSATFPDGETDAGADGDDTIEWDPQAQLPSTTQFYTPKGRRTPALAIILAVIIGGGAFVAVGVYAYQKTRHPPIVVVRQDSSGAPAIVKKPKALIDLNGDQELARQAHAKDQTDASPATSPAATDDASAVSSPAPAGSSAAAADRTAIAAHPVHDTTPPPPPAHEEAPPDPNDTEWNEIRSAHFNVRHQGVAILKYDEYRRDHPGKFTAQLDQYTDEAINWLYWQRVAQLWARQDELVAQLRQKTRDITNQPAGDFHDQLVKDKADLQTKADQTKDLLTNEMGYRGDAPPDLESPKQLKTLAESRDPAKYTAFRRRVLRYVRDNHGGVWWDGE